MSPRDWNRVRMLYATLYATFEARQVIEVVQYVLPGFWDTLFPTIGAPPMKGMFAGEKPSNPSYRPAIDGLSTVDPTQLLRAIVATISSGAAVQFSCTRDFGALVVTVLDGNDRHKVYPTTAQEIAQAVNDLEESFSQQPPPKASTARTR